MIPTIAPKRSWQATKPADRTGPLAGQVIWKSIIASSGRIRLFQRKNESGAALQLQATRAISWFRAKECERNRAKNSSSAVRTGAKPILVIR